MKTSFRKYTRKEYMDMIGKAVERATKGRCIIIFFGSIVDERFSRTSDIDVAVYCGRKLSSGEILKIKEEINKLPILREVDLVDVGSITDIKFIDNIIKGKIWKSTPELLKDLKKRLQSLKK
ncbi:nucleotidyltransferase domain-containing protein [Persephonella sp.]|uniref:nucleotidyltransferase domain-containing protein n=1 Tax=Persephonella sp. TaxID=2060922 RepID=UPI0025F08096|nr:nucleotidyltransferase domain-containing protein [Persephonella sp.]